MSQESVSLTIRTPNYYHREYANDVAAWQQPEPEANGPPQQEETCTNICARVAVVALPFVALYKPAGFFLSLGLNGVRSVSSITELLASLVNGELQDTSYSHVLQVAVSVIAIASTIFAHPLGMLVSTGHDLLAEILHVATLIQAARHDELLESLLKTVNHVIYLGLFVAGGAELLALSLALQFVLSAYQSREEFRNERYLEAAGHVAMTGIRGYQFCNQAQQVWLKWQMDRKLDQLWISIQKMYHTYFNSGEGLGAKWQFPSNHLPIGVNVGGALVISWNVLNNDTIMKIYENAEGLNGSMITDLDKPSKTNPQLTQREEVVIAYIHEMYKRHDRVILALQGCHPDFTAALTKTFQDNRYGYDWMLREVSIRSSGQNVTICNKYRFKYLGPGNDNIRDNAIDLLFRDLLSDPNDVATIRVINVQNSGNANKEDLAKRIQSAAQRGSSTVVVGDMHFEENEIGGKFSNLTKYPTGISPLTRAGIQGDQIWVSSSWFTPQAVQADDVLASLQKTVDLIAEVRSEELRLEKSRTL